MNDTDVDPLPSHVMALIEAERARPHVPETDQARALRRMETALAVGGAGAAGAGAAATAGAGGAAGAGVAGKAIAPSAGGLFARLTAGPIVGVLVAGAVGAGLGASVRATTETPVPPRVVYVERPASSEVPAVAVPTREPSPLDSATPSPPKPPTAAVPPSAEPAHQGLQASERLLLESARTALGRGDARGALTALDRHMTKFPHGQLAEEREVLAVQALVALGQGVDAKARAARFQKAYPASMFASTVEAAVQASVPPRSDQ